MQAVILSASLLTAEDGVGHYSRILGEAMSTRCQTLVVGLRQRDNVFPDFQYANSLPLKHYLQLIGHPRLRGKETLISLQYVPYAFSSRLGLANPLMALTLRLLFPTGVRHLRLHELWVGWDRAARRKHQVLGFVQRATIRLFVRLYKPCRIDVSTPAHVALLRELGIFAQHEPIFSNIAAPEIRERRADYRRQGQLRLATFGTLPDAWDSSETARHFLDLATRLDLEPQVMLLGRVGGSYDRHLSELRRILGKDAVTASGEVSEAEISRSLMGCDLGLAVTSPLLVGKSGAVAAMLAHGLPVIVARANEQPMMTLPEHCFALADVHAIAAALADTTVTAQTSVETTADALVDLFRRSRLRLF